LIDALTTGAEELGFMDVDRLTDALQRGAATQGRHEEELGRPDPDWPRRPVRSYDVVVLGAGPGGEVAARRLAEAGLDVAIVADRKVGGECSYWACMPSKALPRPSELIAEARGPVAERAFEITFLDPGVRAYAFTFG
jgi:Pyridine nucleotide-disulphide oxidoreductase